MAESFDLESLVFLEQTFYDAGYSDGFAHGRIHGLIEGRALGRQKGFEIWEELGFYQGFVLVWKAKGERSDNRAVHHIEHLLNLIAQFPRVNPSPSNALDSELDIPRLFRQIRSRYKALCSVLGVRPSLRASEGSTAQDCEDPSFIRDGASGEQALWKVENTAKRPAGQDLSF